MKNKRNLIFSFIIPVIIIIIAFWYKKLLGILAIAAYIVYICYLNRSSLYAAKGNTLYTKGDRKSALGWFKKAYECKGCRTNTKISYAYLMLKAGHIEDSERIFNEVSRQENLSKSEQMNVKSNMALVMWKKGDLDRAIEIQTEVYEDYKNSTVYGTLGYFLILKGDLERALKFNLEAYDYNNTDKIILDNLGQNYYLLGSIDKAEEIYKELFKLDPQFPECYYCYGKVLLAKGDKEGALDSMEKALRYKFSFLSTTTREEVEASIKEIEDSVDEKKPDDEGENEKA